MDRGSEIGLALGAAVLAMCASLALRSSESSATDVRASGSLQLERWIGLPCVRVVLHGSTWLILGIGGEERIAGVEDGFVRLVGAGTETWAPLPRLVLVDAR